MIKLIKSSFYKEAETKRRLRDFIDRTEIFSMSAECKRFEERFAKKQERKYAVFVNSGSSANLILIQVLLNLGRLKRGDRVGFSALTWSTNVMPIIKLGLVPVAIDCELSTLCVSSATLAPHLTDIKCLFITNVLGFAHDIPYIRELCTKHRIILLEDNCEALGSRVAGVRLGNFSLASTFSFYVGHHLSTIEGGMACTDDRELYHALILVRAHGWDRNLPPEAQKEHRDRHSVDEFYAKYTFYDLGYNVRPTEIGGFLGNEQLQYWDTLVEARERNFKRFHAATLENDDIIPLVIGHIDVLSNFAMPVVLNTPELFRQYRRRFEDADVEVRPIIAGDMTRQPFYAKYVEHIETRPNARFVHENGFYFPNNPELSEAEVEKLVGLLKK